MVCRRAESRGYYFRGLVFRRWEAAQYEGRKVCGRTRGKKNCLKIERRVLRLSVLVAVLSSTYTFLLDGRRILYVFTYHHGCRVLGFYVGAVHSFPRLHFSQCSAGFGVVAIFSERVSLTILFAWFFTNSTEREREVFSKVGGTKERRAVFSKSFFVDSSWKYGSSSSRQMITTSRQHCL